LGALAYRERMELLRSPLEFVDAAGFEAALDGRPMPTDEEPPKKSSPRRESCGFAACFGAGAAGPVRVGLPLGMSAVLGLIGGGLGLKSSNRFTFAAGLGCGGGCEVCACL
jgi:hypothetical protein